ncbi:hypothetical protein AGMMS4952_25100 [Spirochaetia bacterium]|nr:hypothetical protein AGMMS4952_25100 [Spirochaetia bacterium]
MIKKLNRLLLCGAVILGLVLVGCPSDSDEPVVPPPTSQKHAAWGTPVANETVTGSTNGLHEGGSCRVEIAITLVDGEITAVNLTGSTGHTDGLGLPVIENAPAVFKASNNIDVDAITGPTCPATRITLQNAAKQAMNKIAGVNIP